MFLWTDLACGAPTTHLTSVLDLYMEALPRERDEPVANVCLRCGEKTHATDNCRRFKTRICKFWGDGHCNSGARACQFAHGPAELRHPWERKCVRVEVVGPGKYLVRGCGAAGHTFHTCPTRQERILHIAPKSPTTNQEISPRRTGPDDDPPTPESS